MRKSGSTDKKSKASGIVAGMTGNLFADWYAQNRYVAVGIAAVGIVALAVVVPVAIYSSFASTGAADVEPENGSRTSKIAIGSDSNASGGQYITFGTQDVGTGCGLTGAVFCEDFEEPATSPAAQSGDWNPGKISTARFGASLASSAGDGTNVVERADIPACRSGSVTNPFPPGDTLICDANSFIHSRFGLSSTAMQNYGDNSYRIGQPFDIAGRTGTVQFDASLFNLNPLIGWADFTYTEDPIPIPSYYDDNARGAAPRNGVAVQFKYTCGPTPSTAGALIYTYNDYRPTTVTTQSDFDNCSVKPTTKEGYLNRVMIKISQTKIDIYVSDYSNDGVTFGTPKLLLSKPISLNFSRGYLIFGGHNHATIKYTGAGNPYGATHQYNSWTINWDNIAFDGPNITPDKIYQINDVGSVNGSFMTLGWNLPNLTAPLMTPLNIANVDKSGMTSAKLSMSLWFWPVTTFPYSQMSLKYRFNGGTWHSVGFSSGQIWAITNATGGPDCCDNNEGMNNFVIDVPISEINSGTNTVQFQNDGISSGYPSTIANIDLLLR